MIAPPNGYPKVQSLKSMLQYDPDVIIAEPLVLQSLDERNAEEHERHHEEVRKGEDEDVAGDETAEVPGERGPVLFP